MRRALPFVLLAYAGVAHAQSASPYSIQASALATALKLGTGSISGAGVEVQGRYTPLSSFSYGVGAQYTVHKTSADENLTLTGVFVEPRYAFPLANASVGVYLAGRLAALRQTNNFASSSSGWAVGGGAGVLWHLGTRVDLDGGAAVVAQSLGDITLNGRGSGASFPTFAGYVAKIGLNVGFGTRKL